MTELLAPVAAEELMEGLPSEAASSNVSIPGVIEGLTLPPMPRRTRLDSQDSVRSIASARSGRSSNNDSNELQFQFRDSYMGDSLDPSLSNNFSLAENSRTVSGPLYLETASAYLDLQQNSIASAERSPYHLQTGRHLDDDDEEGSGEGHYYPYNFHSSYDSNDQPLRDNSETLRQLEGYEDSDDDEADDADDNITESDSMQDSKRADDARGVEADAKKDLLSDIVFLSPHWLKEAMIGVLDEDIRAKLNEIR